MKYFLIFIISILLGCKSIHSGTYNSNNQYVPVNPQFALKNKEGFSPPSNINLPSLFQLQSIQYLGQEIYPVDPTDPQANLDPLNNMDFFVLFLKNGRCLSFSKESGLALTIDDLNPTKPFYSQQYYFPLQDDKLIIENFVSADGAGQYVYFIYQFSDDNRIIESIDERKQIPSDLSRLEVKTMKTRRIYKQIDIPGTITYPIDW